MSGISIAFRVSNRVIKGDTIRCSFPGFTSALGSRTFFTESATFAQASWDVTTSALTLTSSGVIEESDLSLYQVTVAGSAGLALPCAGISPDGPVLSIRSFAVAGPTLEQPFVSLQLIGTFGTSPTLRFLEPTTVSSGQPVNLNHFCCEIYCR